MGQAQSVPGAESLSDRPPEPATEAAPPPPPPPPPPVSMEALVAEATSETDVETKSVDLLAQRALECPCVGKMRSSPCWTPFAEAFVCYYKSTSEEKGSDCMSPFIALQNCIKAKPDAFDALNEGESEDRGEDCRITLPEWSREP